MNLNLFWIEFEPWCFLFEKYSYFLILQKISKNVIFFLNFSETKSDFSSLKNQNLDLQPSSKDSLGEINNILSSRPRTTEQISSTSKNGAQQLHLATGGKPSTWFPPGELAEL